MSVIDLTLEPGQVVDLVVEMPPVIELEVDTAGVPGPQGPPGYRYGTIPGVVVHGSVPDLERPDEAGFPVVIWVGTVFPLNAIDGDIYMNVSPRSS